MSTLHPIKPEISFEDFEKIDIRVGAILLVEDVADSHRLVRLKVDFGTHQSTVIVGMKNERDNPKEIEGLQALFVVNLPPRKVMGEVSEAMIFDIGYANKITPVLAMPEKPVPNGSQAG